MGKWELIYCQSKKCDQCGKSNPEMVMLMKTKWFISFHHYLCQSCLSKIFRKHCPQT